MPYNNPFASSFGGGNYGQAYGPGGRTGYANPFQDPSYYAQVYNPQTGMDNRGILGTENGRPGWGLYTSQYGGPNKFQDWLGNQQNKQYTQYLGQAALNPTLQWYDYLKNWNARGDYEKLSPQDRGYSPGSWSAPYVRYTPAR